MKEIKLISPLDIKLYKTKKFILNLNQYRNLHYRVLNNAKIKYKEHMEKQISKLEPIDKPICLVYTVYKGDNRSYDVSNICSVHDKFFEDALVELGKLPDDNHKYVPMVVYLEGQRDRFNPRVSVEILPIDNELLNKIGERINGKQSQEN